LIGQQDLAVARSELGEIRAEFFPSINLSSSYSYNRSESQAGFFEMNKTYGYSYGAQVSWNLFNGFNTYREIQNARLNRRSKQIYMEELKTNLLSDFSALALKYRNSLTRMQLEQENVGVASENVKIALEIYQLGTITPLQLREVQKNYVAAKSRLISTAYEVKQNEVGLLQLSGELVKGELE
jgi:outer membrane protein TolC